jgi:arylsulfatase A-like enzyme
VRIHYAYVKRTWNRLRRTGNQLLDPLRQGLAILVALAFVLAPITSSLLNAPAAAKPAPRGEGRLGPTAGGCDLRSARSEIQHVIYIQFDNVHFRRDNPNVPSDLEQMPNLLNFLEGNGVLMTNHHTPLKSHTADDIITSLTGVYPDRHGMPVANSFGWFTPPGSQYFDGFSSSFAYWTDIVNATTDPSYYMVTPEGKNAPAPWVPWTRAGCNVGAVSIANMEFENVTSDINNVFGPNSPEAQEAVSNRAQAVADFEGISVHCAAGNPVCSPANSGEPDVLPQEPGGYAGFNALYGHKFVAPVISPNGPLNDLDGNLITDGNGHTGFPGFGGISAAQSLAYVAAMQEHGVPVTYAYISDAHDNHAPGGQAFGPGEAGYVAQLAAYNEAFGKFFARLAQDGITKRNTLFVITADEGDHFAGGPPTPSTCDGVTIPCTYSKIGEINSNIQSLLAEEDPSFLNPSTGAFTPAFDIQYDMVPVFYISGNPPVGDATARKFERDAAKLTALSPITQNTDQLTEALADPVELKLLHMVTGDPQRTPSFIMFGNPDWYFTLSGPDAVEAPGYAWNHGGIDPEIVTTFLGLAGPGVKNSGIDDEVWSDHTDIRPTMLALTGLKDDYQDDGRVLVEELQQWAWPDGVSDSGDEFVELARAYKAINAPNADLGRTTLSISTRALASGSPGNDSTYVNLENQLSRITFARDALASQMLNRLDGAEFYGKRIAEGDERQLTRQAEWLLALVHAADTGH